MATFINALPSAIALGLIWGIMAIGVYITYKSLDIADLTVDGSITTGGVVAAVLITNGVNAWLAILLAFVAGMLTGLITGFFHTVFGIPAILSGILTQLMLWSINLKILNNKANLAVSSRSFKTLLTSLNVPSSLLLLVIVTIVIIAALYWFFGTEIGAAIRATGCNPNMSKAQGININITKVVGLMLSNGLVALSGALLAQYQGFADVSMGKGAIVIGLASIIIGSAVVSLIPKLNSNFAMNLFGAALGGVIYYIVYQFIVSTGFDTNLLKMLSALVVALFLGVPYMKKQIQAKGLPAFKKKGGN